MKLFQKMRKFVTLLALAAILVGVPGLCSLEVSAEGPVTYSVKYVPASGEWRYQANTSTFDDNAYHRELYYLRQELKAGDAPWQPDSHQLQRPHHRLQRRHR